ncbi:hypothetical protein PR048_017124 [Dryococelus australis]|uniref:Uncharacterized protein n=1 Tax=Dryococelus australis TaxID=614101 RepID=A0ABQ9H8M8_9NEOP|nr:hypothetical protein PR048_017124 [Dryococelus australis]
MPGAMFQRLLRSGTPTTMFADWTDTPRAPTQPYRTSLGRIGSPGEGSSGAAKIHCSSHRMVARGMTMNPRRYPANTRREHCRQVNVEPLRKFLTAAGQARDGGFLWAEMKSDEMTKGEGMCPDSRAGCVVYHLARHIPQRSLMTRPVSSSGIKPSEKGSLWQGSERQFLLNGRVAEFRAIEEPAAREVTSGREICDYEYKAVKGAAGRLDYWTGCWVMNLTTFAIPGSLKYVFCEAARLIAVYSVGETGISLLVAAWQLRTFQRVHRENPRLSVHDLLLAKRWSMKCYWNSRNGSSVKAIVPASSIFNANLDSQVLSTDFILDTFGTALAERLACSPPTNVNRVQSPAGSPDFCMWESCWTMPLVGGFPQPLHYGTASYSYITVIGFQDIASVSQSVSQSVSHTIYSPGRWAVASLSYATHTLVLVAVQGFITPDTENTTAYIAQLAWPRGFFAPLVVLLLYTILPVVTVFLFKVRGLTWMTRLPGAFKKPVRTWFL